MNFFKRTWFAIVLAILFTTCAVKKDEQAVDEKVTVEGSDVDADSSSAYPVLPETDWDFTGLYGVYIHEGSSGGYSATLILEPQGLNIAFTLVSSKGETCRGEASGNIAMVDHKEYYDTGYWVSEDCKLEFIFRHQDKKVDVKEIHLCTLHEQSCSFEGTYKSRD